MSAIPTEIPTEIPTGTSTEFSSELTSEIPTETPTETPEKPKTPKVPQVYNINYIKSLYDMILKAADVEKNPERMARTVSEPVMEKECGKPAYCVDNQLIESKQE